MLFFRKLLCNPRSRLRYPAFLSHCDQALHSINPSLLPDSEHLLVSICTVCRSLVFIEVVLPVPIISILIVLLQIPGFQASGEVGSPVLPWPISNGNPQPFHMNADWLPDLLPFFVPCRYDTSPYQVSKRFGSSALPRQWLLVDMNINEAHRHSESRYPAYPRSYFHVKSHLRIRQAWQPKSGSQF